MSRCLLALIVLFLGLSDTSHAQRPVVGPNVNMVTGNKLADGDPFATKQNEVSLAVSALNPDHLLGAANDYRLVALSTSTDIPGEVGAADAWIGLYYSIDKGQTWRSTVLSGCPLNITACNNPLMAGLKTRAFAADPTIRPTPYGGYLLSFIAGNRDSAANGLVGVVRFFDKGSQLKPGEVPFNQVDPFFTIDTGTTGQFKDKSWLAVDEPARPWNGADTCTIPGFSAPVPAFNAYVSYSNFVGQSADNPHPQILVARSTDCGRTFEKPVKVSQSTATNSGSVVVVNPVNGDVYVIWRQFFTATNGSPDAFYFAKSTDGGRRFSSPTLITTFTPFDQGTGTAQFRTNAFPTAAVSVDGSGKPRIHVAFAARKGGPTGDARIMMSTSADNGNTWLAPVFVDDWVSDPLLETVPVSNRNPGRGHQFQPTMTAVAGKIALGWFDQRYDHTEGALRCPPGVTCTSMKDYREYRVPAGELAGSSPQFDKVFTPFLSDSTGLSRKHTIDFFGALADPADRPVFSSARVSQYRFASGRRNGGPLEILQAEYNVPNRPIFVNNTRSFIGDYAEVSGPVFVPTRDAQKPYRFNTDVTNRPVFHASWTDNRKVVPPRSGNWNDRTPISVITPSGTLAANTNCQVGYEGTQNQELFTAPFGEGLGVFSPVPSKQLKSDVARGFVIGLQNMTETKVTYRLLISGPTSGTASFSQPRPGEPWVPVTQINLEVLPRSSATRTVWVISPIANAGVDVNVFDSTGVTKLATIRLNPDSKAPLAGTTDGNPDTSNNDLSDVTVKTVRLENTELTNTELTNTELTNTELTNTELTNTELTNTELTNTELTNTELTNTELTNTELTNTELTNTELTNTELTNTELTNNTFINTELTNSAFADAQFKIANNGNVETALSIKTLLRDTRVPEGFKLQMVVRRIAWALIPGACTFNLVQQATQVVNIPTPLVTAPDDPTLTTFVATDSRETNATLPLLPGERAQVVVRFIGPNTEAAKQYAENALKLVAVGADGSRTRIPLIIKTLALPVWTALKPFSFQLDSVGGNGTRTWSPQAGYTLPSWLTLSPTGLLSGTPPTAETVTLKLRLTDQSIPAQEDKQTLILVVERVAQTVTLAGIPTTNKTFGDPPFAVTATSTSAIAPVVTGSGACSASGNMVSINSAGQCTVTAAVAQSDVYAGASATQSFQVLPAVQTISFAAIAPKTYGDPSFNLSVSANSNLAVALTPSGACTVSGTTVTITGAGSCSITASQAGNANYLPAANEIRSFNIAKAALSVTADSFSRPYGVANPVLTGTFAGVVNADNITVKYTTTAQELSPAGLYTITPELVDPSGRLANYLVSKTDGTLTIGKLLATVTAANVERYYGAGNQFTGTVTGVFGGETLTVTYTSSADAATSPGIYDIVPQVTANPVAANYELNIVNGKLLVKPAPLTVTALNASKVYGDPLPPFSVAFSGFVLNQGAGNLGGSLGFITNPLASSDSPVATYSIIPTGLTSANYAITYVPGNLAVTQATPQFSELANPTIAAGATSVTLSGRILLGTRFPTGNVAVTLNGVTQQAPIRATDGFFTTNMPFAAVSTGTFPVVYSYPGDTNFKAITGSGAVKSEGWISSGNMTQVRADHQAVMLADGTVLLTGGTDGKAGTATAEVFDPVTGNTTAVGNLPNKSTGHTATRLLNGKVLIAGGGNSASEVYDPATRTFSGTGGMSSQRSFHTATLLSNGMVLVTGGENNSGVTQSSAQLFNPATGNFETTGSMSTARVNHSATLLPDGRVLIVGGRQIVNKATVYLASAEIYDPATRKFTRTTSNLAVARSNHAQALVGGKVYILGGRGSGGGLASVESFDASTGVFSATANMATPRVDLTATPLADGRLLIAGGSNGTAAQGSCEFLLGTALTAGPAMGSARSRHTAIRLNDGRVLVTGGTGAAGTPVASMEIYGAP